MSNNSEQIDHSKFKNFDTKIKGLFISGIITSIINFIVIVLLIIYGATMKTEEVNDKKGKTLIILLYVFIPLSLALNIASSVLIKDINTDYYKTSTAFAIINGIFFIYIMSFIFF